MKARNDLRYSFELLFFEYMKERITLEDLIAKLYTLEDSIREEEDSTNLEEGLCFRWFEGGTMITTIRNLEDYLSNSRYHSIRGGTIEDMKSAISLDTDFELQIYFA